MKTGKWKKKKMNKKGKRIIPVAKKAECFLLCFFYLEVGIFKKFHLNESCEKRQIPMDFMISLQWEWNSNICRRLS
jgi:hypothetical protein